ncbi:MAG: hypothetical protein O2807_08305 [bacterium]|nr:hypothetical protein [bacterium]
MATMRAPVLLEAGVIRFEERPVPEPGPGEVEAQLHRMQGEDKDFIKVIVAHA